VQCRVLQVSSSGLYQWRSRPKPDKSEDERILDTILSFFEESDSTYGVKRLADYLKESGEKINHKRVARIKRENGLYPKQYNPYVVTTDSSHGKPFARNILDSKFRTSTPNAVWVSDITYIPYAKGFLYLAAIIDLCSRKVVGWQLGDNMKACLVVGTD
jgi:putative transposase